MAVKIPEAAARLYNRVWVCRRCKHTMRADAMKIREGKIVCRTCHNRAFRPKKKERKAVK